jgi:hypothetical protein
MPVTLFISGGRFDLDTRYNADDVRDALGAFTGLDVSFELRDGGFIHSRVTSLTDWTVLSLEPKSPPGLPSSG